DLTYFVPTLPFPATSTSHIATLSLHDALPISMPNFPGSRSRSSPNRAIRDFERFPRAPSANRTYLARSSMPRAKLSLGSPFRPRSEEHTSELQSLRHLVCRLLLEKKKKKYTHT